MNTIDPIEKIRCESSRTNSFVCVGLDPILSSMPVSLTSHFGDTEAIIYNFITTVVNLTEKHCCAYKIQKAFFDQYEFGHSLLKRIITYIKDAHQNKAIIVDCKIGDIEHTLKAYTHNILRGMGADGIVVNPFMGKEIFDAFHSNPDKIFIVLVRTSNAGGSVIQDIILENKEKFWVYLLKMVTASWVKTPNIVPVLSFNDENDYNKVREIIPDEMPIFWAGYGVQGRSITGINRLLDSRRSGLIVNSSRGILYENYERYDIWEDAISQNVLDMQRHLNQLSII